MQVEVFGVLTIELAQEAQELLMAVV